MRIVIPPSWRTRIYRYRITATKCKKCGRTAYPPSNICRYCGSREIEFVDLLNENARLITWTIIYNVMEGFEERRPVILGILETLDSKARVMAPLTDVLPDELKPGMVMEPVLRRIMEEGEHGLIHYGVSYRPLIKSSQ
ncbi:MAG: Zn-ribbon domain-containing OB-fold protein [Desulfurococcaceae archaeon]